MAIWFFGFVVNLKKFEKQKKAIGNMNKNNWPKEGEYWRQRSGTIVGPLINNSGGFGLTRFEKLWHSNGFCFFNGSEHLNDLVERVKVEPFPHPEPREWQVIILEYLDADGSPSGKTFATSKYSDSGYPKDRYKVVAGPITITEG